MAVTYEQGLAFVQGFAAAIAENKAYLTELDSPIGDADHGTNMDRGMQAVLPKVGALEGADLSQLFKTTAMTLISTVGGASGPLYGTLFLQLGTTITGKTGLATQDWSQALEAAVLAVRARGKAQLEDKTMIAALQPPADSLREPAQAGATLDAALAACEQAAEQGMQATIPLVARKGRASYLGERSAGHQDTGATSSWLLVRAARQLSRLIRELGVRRTRMAEYVGALDQGTTSTRFMIFDHSGGVVGIDQKEHEQICPKPGWVEHDALEIWTRCQEVIKGALQKTGLKASDLAAVGITNQRETAVVWDKKTGKPVHNAIVWQDTRTDLICNELAKDGGQDRFRAKVGLPLATYFSGPKVKWLLENVEGLRAKAEAGDLAFGNIDTWCLWNLTGGVNGGLHIPDVTNASRTMLMNLATLDWDPEILKIMGIPKAMLPQIRPSSEVYGKCVGELAGIPVAGD